jgi:hypothetical protein
MERAKRINRATGQQQPSNPEEHMQLLRSEFERRYPMANDSAARRLARQCSPEL